MDCSLIDPWLVPFHFGELADPERGSLEQHLQSCPICLDAFLALKRGAESPQAVPPRLRADIRAASRRELPQPARTSWYLGIAATAAAAVVLVMMRPQAPHLPVATAPSQTQTQTQPDPNHAPAAGRHVDTALALAASLNVF